MNTIDDRDMIPMWKLVKAFDIRYTRLSDIFRAAGIPIHQDRHGQSYASKVALHEFLTDAAAKVKQ